MINRLRSGALQREQMLASILEQAARGPGTSLMAARALHVAFAFQLAVNNGMVGRYLGAASAAHLRYLAIVYQAIGATGVAHTLFEALTALENAVTPSERRKCIVGFEARLFVTVDPVYDLIAQLTQSVH